MKRKRFKKKKTKQESKTNVNLVFFFYQECTPQTSDVYAYIHIENHNNIYYRYAFKNT
jgi:hypothetical protein